MALLFLGKTVCQLCKQVIMEGDLTISFPAFIVNEADPCYLFSDGAFHSKCVQNNNIGKQAIQRFDEWRAKVGPGKRKCGVCQLEITDPDNYLLIEGLSGDITSPLHAFNYTHLHKSCIPKWVLRDNFVAAAKNSLDSGQWKGHHIPYLLSQLGIAK